MEQLSFAEIYKRRKTGLDMIFERSKFKEIMSAKQEERMLKQNLRGLDPISAQKELLRVEILRKQLGYELPEHKRKELLVYGGRSIRNPSFVNKNPVVSAINSLSTKIINPEIAKSQLPPKYSRYQFIYDIAKKQVQSGYRSDKIIIIDMRENEYTGIDLNNDVQVALVKMSKKSLISIAESDILYKDRFIFVYYPNDLTLQVEFNKIDRICKTVLPTQQFFDDFSTTTSVRPFQESIRRRDYESFSDSTPGSEDGSIDLKRKNPADYKQEISKKLETMIEYFKKKKIENLGDLNLAVSLTFSDDIAKIIKKNYLIDISETAAIGYEKKSVKKFQEIAKNYGYIYLSVGNKKRLGLGEIAVGEIKNVVSKVPILFDNDEESSTAEAVGIINGIKTFSSTYMAPTAEQLKGLFKPKNIPSVAEIKRIDSGMFFPSMPEETKDPKFKKDLDKRLKEKKEKK